MANAVKMGSVLSAIDRKLLKIILAPDGKVSSKALAKELGIPETTIQRHRRRLEKEFLKVTYALDLTKFGWHRVDFFVASERGKTDRVAAEVMKFEEVVFVGKSIGQQTIDLHVQTILMGNAEILQMMERLKGMEGIKDVIWSEIVHVVGKKTSIPFHVIDRL